MADQCTAADLIDVLRRLPPETVVDVLSGTSHTYSDSFCRTSLGRPDLSQWDGKGYFGREGIEFDTGTDRHPPSLFLGVED